MTTIKLTGNLQEALLIKSILEGNGVAAFVPDELTAQNAPPYVWATGGVRVQVEDEQVEAAKQILASEIPDAGPSAATSESS